MTETLQKAYQAGHHGAVLADYSAHGRLRITGGDRLTFVHNLTTSDVKALKQGEGQPAAMVNQRAGILDLLYLYATDDALLVVTGPGRAGEDLAWMDRYLFSEDVQLSDESEKTVLWYLTGARAAEMVESSAAGLPPFGHAEVMLGTTPVILMRTDGLVGEGYFIWAPAQAGSMIKETLLNRGAMPVAEDDLELLRVEAGLPRLGAELTESQNPWEARLDQAISLSKGCYLGQEVVARLNAYNKVQRYLVGLDLRGAEVPAPQDKLLFEDKEIGWVTSAALPPGSEQAIALAYVKGAYAEPGTSLLLSTQAGVIPVTVSARPFWQGKTRQAGAISRS